MKPQRRFSTIVVVAAFCLAANCWGVVAPAAETFTVAVLDCSGSRTGDLAQKLAAEGIVREENGQRVVDEYRARDWIRRNTATINGNQLVMDMRLLVALAEFEEGPVEVYPFTHEVFARTTLDEATQERLLADSLIRSPGTSITGALQAGLTRMSEVVTQGTPTPDGVRGRLLIFTDGIPGDGEPPFDQILAAHPGLRQAQADGAFEIVFYANDEETRAALRQHIGSLKAAAVAAPEELVAQLKVQPTPTPLPSPTPTISQVVVATTSASPPQSGGSSAGPVMFLTLLGLAGAGVLGWLVLKRPTRPAQAIRVSAARSEEPTATAFTEREFEDDVINLKRDGAAFGCGHLPLVDEDAVIVRAKGRVHLEAEGKRSRLRPGERVKLGDIFVWFDYIEPEPAV